jgi:putative acetyltransferase
LKFQGRVIHTRVLILNARMSARFHRRLRCPLICFDLLVDGKNLMIIPREAPSDYSAVRKIVEAAFPTSAEANLIEQLRSDGDAIISMVAVDGVIVGHAMLSRMTAPFRELGLGPVAVVPEQQRKGIGHALVCSALKKAEDEGWQGVFVLGAPDWYQRFGFDASLARGFASPYAGPHLMALSFNGPLPVVTGRIYYAPAFVALG